jgi:hypothetical protein
MDEQQQFDGQSSVPGYTLFQGKDGQNFYLKGEGLGDDEIKQRVSTLRSKAGAQPAPPAQATPEAIEKNKQETDFEKENKPSWYGEALRTAAKIPLKSVGFDTNSQSPVSDWLKQNAKYALGTFKPSLNPPPPTAADLRGDSEPSMVRDVVHGMNDTSREGETIWKTGRSVEPAAANQEGAFQTRPGGPVQRLGDELEHPKLAGALRVAAANVPVLGPGAVHAGHQIALATTPQELGEGIAEGGGVAGQALLATEPGQRLANAAIEKVGGPIKRAGAAVAESAGNLVSRFRTPEAQKAMTQAIEPGVNIPRAQESIGIAGPRMQQVREATGREVNNTEDALELNRDAKKVVLQSIEDRLGPVADLQPDTSSVAESMRGSVDKITRKQYGGAAGAIDRRAAVYDEGGHTFRDIENRIQTLNNHLRNFYKQPTFGESPISMDAEASLAEVAELRKVLDSGVENLSGDGVKDLKREYGALRDVERSLARQHAIATRTKGAGLWEGLAYLHAAGELASGNLLGVAKSAATLTAGKRLATLRDPNYLLRQAFHGKGAFDAAEAIPAHGGPPAPKGLLRDTNEHGLPEVSSNPVKDTSGPARGGRWTTPAAQIEGEKPIEAKFIREIPRGTAQPFRAQLPEQTEGGFLRRAMEKSTVPPAVDERFAREETRPPAGNEQWSPERQVGAAGRGGIRTTPGAALPGLSLEAGRALVQQTLDMLRSGDRPGRYYDENEMGEYNSQKEQSASRGVTSGGKWRGVSSMRTMLPWLNETEFSPEELDRALRAFDKGKITAAMRSAMEFSERENAPRTREPGEEEEPGAMPAAQGYKPSAKAQEMSAPRQGLGPEFEAGEVSHEIERNKAILRNSKATAEDRAVARAKLKELQGGR